MYSYLKSHPANITVKIDGLAASSASIVAMAGNKVIMPSNALIMIHNPSSSIFGEAEDLRDEADILDKIRDTFANIYIAKTGLEREKIISMMNAETWLSAQEAHDLKFCDEISDAVQIAAMSTKTGGFIYRTPAGFSQLDNVMAAKMPEKFKERQGRKQTMPESFNITNAADLERQFSQFAGEIRLAADEAGYNRGVQAERERIKMLDSLYAPGREAILAKAKYEEPKDARDVALELVQADKNTAKLKAMGQDASAVNLALNPQQTHPDEAAEEARIVEMIAKQVNSIRGMA